MDKSGTTKVLIVILSLFLLITIVSQAVVVPQNVARTEVARLYQMNDTVKLDAVLLRDEHTVAAKTDGILLYEYDDGARVAKNTVIASVYAKGEDIELCRRIDTLNLRLETLKDAQSLAGTDSSQVEAFNKLITEKHSELMTAIQNGNYDEIDTIKYQLLNLQSKRDIAKGKTDGYESVISGIEEEITSLENRISSSPKTLVAGETGYFVSSTDGYEGELSIEAAKTITPAQINEILKAPAKTAVKTDIIGKMIEDYNWKLAAVLNDHDATLIEVGRKVKLTYAADGSTIDAVADSVTKQADGTSVVIFSGDILTPALAAARIGKFELLIEGYSGIRIPSQAIRFNEKGEKGVYILSGNIGYFRKINELYSGEDFVICEYNPYNDEYLELYENVIVSGKFEEYKPPADDGEEESE